MMLGFKRRFESMVVEGSKTHTIRAKRKRRPKPGEGCHCYGDIRQKSMHLLGRWPCTRVQDIRISKSGEVTVDGERLQEDERNLLAWRDGFRPAGSTESKPGNAFEIFFRYWRTMKQNGKKRALPFNGDLIHWDYRRTIQGPKKRRRS